jgi:hypothetical protein
MKTSREQFEEWFPQMVGGMPENMVKVKDIIGEMLNDGILEEGTMFNRKVLLVTERENDDFTW